MAVEKTQGVFTTFNSDTQSTYTGIGIVGAPGIADQFFLTTRLSAPDSKVQVNSQALLLFSVWRNRKTTTTTLIDPPYEKLHLYEIKKRKQKQQQQHKYALIPN